MKFKVKIGEMEIEAESAEAVRELAAVFGTLPGTNGTASKAGLNESIQERLRRIRMKVVRPEQVGVLEALASREEGLSDAALLVAANLTAPVAIQGVMQALSKYAKSVGLEPRHVITKTIRKTEAGRSYHYRLTPEMRELMKEGGKK